MKTDTKFPLGLWLIGWIVTTVAIYSSYVLEAAWEYIFLAFASFCVWPVIMGLFIGEILRFVG